jgi:lipopolysaccharide heptosyltransferase II
MTRAELWQDATRILCVRLDAMGDVLMTTPAIRALKEAGSDRTITLLTSSAGASVAPLIPEINACWVHEAPWMKATPPRRDRRAEWAMINRLREGRFDAAVIFTVYSQNPWAAAYLCYLAEIPLRLAHCRENPYQLLTDWVPDLEPQRLVRHEVRRQLELVAATGARPRDERLSLRVPDDARRRVACRLKELAIDETRPWVAIHPGASAPSRRYEADRFAMVTRRLVRDLGWQVVFTGSASESELVDSIRAEAGEDTHSLAGQLDLAELAALLDRAPLLIANNTGPVHVAAAVGTPVVDLYALTNPQHTPWKVPHRVLNHDVPCQPCYRSVCPEEHHNCLRLVTPDEVVRAAMELLGTSPRSARDARHRNTPPTPALNL